MDKSITMKTRTFLLVVMLAVFVVGCQSPLRKYDGVLGYKVVSNTKAKISIFYTDEDRRSWSNVEKRAMLACKHEFKNNSSVVSMTVLKQEQFIQQVEMAIKIPASESSMGAGTANGKGMLNAVTTLPSNNNQMVMRPLKLKRLVVECNGQ
ncbi:MAG: hypothetical protein IPI79_13300 [Moraxellaceae bacterium]|nr:hypothetical protein [Moraxellaceae bacterium]